MFNRSIFQNKESEIWLQNDHTKFVSAFHLSSRVSGEDRAGSISIRFFEITDPFDGRSFLMCSHDTFSEPIKMGSLKPDRVNAFTHFQNISQKISRIKFVCITPDVYLWRG